MFNKSLVRRLIIVMVASALIGMSSVYVQYSTILSAVVWCLVIGMSLWVVYGEKDD